MRSLSIFLSAILALPGAARSQEALSAWREFVLETPGLGVANAIIELRGGGFAAVGYADAGTENGTDAVLVRFDSRGDTLWTRSFGGLNEDVGWDVVESMEGGFFIVGYTEAPTQGREDILVLRVNQRGEPIWERTFGGPGRDRAWSATLSPAGGVVIAAESQRSERPDRDAYLMHISGAGETVWATPIDTPGDQRVYSIARTEDNAYVAVGTSGVYGVSERDAYVVRVDRTGEVAWTKTLGGAPDDVAHGVIALAGGDVMVTGYGGTRSDGGSDIYLLQLDPEGNTRWWRHHGGPDSERGMMSAPRAGGGFVTVGYAITVAGFDILMVESDGEGYELTRAILQRPGPDRGVMILEREGGGYVIVGTLAGADAVGDFTTLWQPR